MDTGNIDTTKIIPYDILNEGDLLLELPQDNAHGHANYVLKIASKKVTIIDMPGSPTTLKSIEYDDGYRMTATENKIIRIKNYKVKAFFVHIVGQVKAQTTLTYSETSIQTIKNMDNEGKKVVGRFHFLDHKVNGSSVMTESTVIRILKFSSKLLTSGTQNYISATRGVTCLHWLLISMQSAFILRRMTEILGQTKTKKVIKKMYELISQNIVKKRTLVNKQQLISNDKWILAKPEFSNYNITLTEFQGNTYKDVWNKLMSAALGELEEWTFMGSCYQTLNLDILLPGSLHVDAKYSSPKKFINGKGTDNDLEIITKRKS